MYFNHWSYVADHQANKFLTGAGSQHAGICIEREKVIVASDVGHVDSSGQ